MQKTAVITGAANGIGRAMAETFVANGYYVLAIDLDESAARRLEVRLAQRAAFFIGDVGQKKDLDGFVAFVKARTQNVHALLNNACFMKGGLADCSYEDFSYVLALGVTAPFYLTQQLLPLMPRGASVVNIASTRAFMSQPNTESYSAAKGGISALTHAMCVSLSNRVRVNAISPGWIETCEYHELEARPAHSREDRLQHPSGRVGEPMDIAALALYLCGDCAGFINGENITVDGGMTRQMIYHNDCGWKLEL